MKKFKKTFKSFIYFLVEFALSFLLLLFVLPATAAPIVLGYWENWGTYQNFPMPHNATNSKNEILSSQLTGLTALAYAFLEVANDGSIIFSDIWSDLDPNSKQDKQFCSASPASCHGYPQSGSLGNFSAFAKTSVPHHVISVGGAGHDATWENAFANPDKFVASLKTMVDTYKVDWLDIDYEPLGGVPAHNIPRFITLTDKIKLTLPNLIMSYTIAANSNNVKSFGAENWKKLGVNVNYVSIMGYDMHGVFDVSNPKTALHSALIAEKGDFSVESTLKALNNSGIANHKIILGMPVYGRAVGGVATKGLGQQFTQAVEGDLDEKNCSTNLYAGNACGGMTQYKTLIDQAHVAFPVNINGELSGVYAYDANKKIFVSYDNAESATAKTRYAVKNQLAGVMFWTLRFDKPVNNPHSILGAIDKVYGIVPK